MIIVQVHPQDYTRERIEQAMKRAERYGGVDKYLKDIHGRDMHGMETIYPHEWEDAVIFEEVFGKKLYSESARKFVGVDYSKISSNVAYD